MKISEISEDQKKLKMSKIFDFFEKKEKKKNLFGTELEDLVPSDCLIPTVISKERVILRFRLEIHGPVSPRTGQSTVRDF